MWVVGSFAAGGIACRWSRQSHALHIINVLGVWGSVNCEGKKLKKSSNPGNADGGGANGMWETGTVFSK